MNIKVDLLIILNVFEGNISVKNVYEEWTTYFAEQSSDIFVLMNKDLKRSLRKIYDFGEMLKCLLFRLHEHLEKLSMFCPEFLDFNKQSPEFKTVTATVDPYS